MPKINLSANKSKIIVIVGPTASGKSDLGIKLAKKFNGEIISADSRQVYRGMDIGTGKISKREQEIVLHHLIDVASPKKQFTVDNFKKLGRKAIDDILNRGKIPIIVGGAGFYIDVLLGRVPIAEVPPNPKLRAKLEKQTTEQLYSRLLTLDPQRAKTIDPKNKRRLIRALEISTKKNNLTRLKQKRVLHPMHDRDINTDLQKYQTRDMEYKILWLGLKPENLKRKIKKRLEERLKRGMVKEVKNLLKSGVDKKRLYDLGLEYRWVSRYLNKEANYKEMREGLLQDIIKYSKRQTTWFKRNKEIHWVKNRKEAEKFIRKFLSSHP